MHRATEGTPTGGGISALGGLRGCASLSALEHSEFALLGSWALQVVLSAAAPDLYYSQFWGVARFMSAEQISCNPPEAGWDHTQLELKALPSQVVLE